MCRLSRTTAVFLIPWLFCSLRLEIILSSGLHYTFTCTCSSIHSLLLFLCIGSISTPTRLWACWAACLHLLIYSLSSRLPRRGAHPHPTPQGGGAPHPTPQGGALRLGLEGALRLTMSAEAGQTASHIGVHMDI